MGFIEGRVYWRVGFIGGRGLLEVRGRVGFIGGRLLEGRVYWGRGLLEGRVY